ncbi:hypothetical protein KP509_18G038300 [Ceratopteris richardii]|uniref:Uncharacterized protein n=1 Tax=Ceratopteris richardii TaxID=49495 RepID=A0A8T2STD8_CERRI|nr:hypothetical protein KP509_18G038300 [Ceratopteris richardii]
MDTLHAQHFSFNIPDTVKNVSLPTTYGRCRIPCRHLPSFSLSSSPLRSSRLCRSLSGESAAIPATDQPASTSIQSDESSEKSRIVDESVAVLKRAAKTRKVPGGEVIKALLALEKAKLDPSSFFATIGGGPESPGPRTWMLIFTANSGQISETQKGGSGKGTYFPITAVQKFDATAMTIENGVYLGPLGCLTFSGRLNWNKRILTFVFDTLNLKIGSLGPFKFNVSKEEEKNRAPSSNKDPFFVWHYADEEIIAARGRGGGLAFWCRCKRVPT